MFGNRRIVIRVKCWTFSGMVSKAENARSNGEPLSGVVLFRCWILSILVSIGENSRSKGEPSAGVVNSRKRDLVVKHGVMGEDEIFLCRKSVCYMLFYSVFGGSRSTIPASPFSRFIVIVRILA